jgi:predicted kinase
LAVTEAQEQHMAALPLTLVMLAGMPGTGKSTLGRAIAASLDWLVLDKDIIHTALLQAGSSSADAGAVAYRVALKLAEDLVVLQRRSLVLDTAGRQPIILSEAQRIVRNSGARLKVIRCMLAPQVRARRLSAREPLPAQWSADETTPEQESVWYAHLPEDTLLLDTAPPLEETVEQALAFIRAEPPLGW